MFGFNKNQIFGKFWETLRKCIIKKLIELMGPVVEILRNKGQTKTTTIQQKKVCRLHHTKSIIEVIITSTLVGSIKYYYS